MTPRQKFSEVLRLALKKDLLLDFSEVGMEALVLEALKESSTVIALRTPNHCPMCAGKGRIVDTYKGMIARRECEYGHVWYTRGRIIDGHYTYKVVAKQVNGMMTVVP